MSDKTKDYTKTPVGPSEVPAKPALNGDNNYDTILVDGIIVFIHKKVKSSDPRNWSKDMQEKMVMSIHGALPKNWQSLFSHEGEYRSCDECFEVLPKDRFPDEEWYAMDSTIIYCDVCCRLP